MSLLNVSRFLINQVKNHRKNVFLLEKFNFSSNENNNNDKDKLKIGQTTILFQDGINIQELPVVVKKVGQDEFLSYCNSSEAKEDVESVEELPEKVRISLINPKEVIKNIRRCSTINGVLAIISNISDEDLSPRISGIAFMQLLNKDFFLDLKSIESSQIITRLIDSVIADPDNERLIHILMLCSVPPLLDLTVLIDKIENELLLRNVENKVNIEEICEIVRILYFLKRNSTAEKFWLSIKEQNAKITSKNIVLLYELLPHVNISRRFILGVLERKIVNLWYLLGVHDIMNILEVLTEIDISPYITINSISRYLYTNIHNIGEFDLSRIIGLLIKLNYLDQNIEKSLEKYIKTKGVKITDDELILKLLEYCLQNRLRNVHILNGISEYFIINQNHIKPNQIKNFLEPYGILDFHPLNQIGFWKSVEAVLDRNFTEIPPYDIVDIMLYCTYLQKYPLNFVKRIFNSYFLDLLHASTPPSKLQKIRGNLKLFDFSLTLESSDYNGPFLPRDLTAKSIWQDGRIKRITNNIMPNLIKAAGGSKDNLTNSVILHQIPVNDLFIVDILFHPKGILNTWNLKMLMAEKNINTAVLIHLPEHYDYTNEYLIGPQVMRIRQFRKLGLRVATLNYETLMKLKIYPSDLDFYLKERLKVALNSL